MYGPAAPRTTSRPLDPIEQRTVARYKLKKSHASAMHLGLRVIVAVLSLVVHGMEPPWITGFPTDLSGPQVNSLYLAHMQELEDCGLVRRADVNQVRFVSGYFEVEKGDRARAIFNGKALSRRTAAHPPANVNLTTHNRIVQEISKERYLVTTVDLRHWFHQIPVSETTQRLFGLRVGRALYRLWRCLPMGWSHSPAIAQASTWMIVLHRNDTQPALFDVEGLRSDEGSLPEWIFTTDGGTAITVYYDNLVILSRTPAQQKEIVRRIRDNMHELNAELKLTKRKEAGLGEPQDTQELRVALDEEWRYTDVRREPTQILGMVVRFFPETDTLVVYPRKRDAWLERAVPASLTCREAAEFIGRLVFAAQLRHTCLYATSFGRRVVSLATRIGIRAHAGGWEGHVDDPILIGSLRDAWKELKASTDEPLPRQALVDRRVFSHVIASDASNGGWGFTVYQLEEGGGHRLIHEARGTYQRKDKRHIFYKELDAALRSVAWAKEKAIGPYALAVDNTAVCWALKHGASRSAAAMAMIERSSLGDAPVADIIAVASEDNPADPASRGASYCVERGERLFCALHWYQRGIRWASRRNGHDGANPIRHEEPDAGKGDWPDDDDETTSRLAKRRRSAG